MFIFSISLVFSLVKEYIDKEHIFGRNIYYVHIYGCIRNTSIYFKNERRKNNIEEVDSYRFLTHSNFTFSAQNLKCAILIIAPRQY